MITDEKAAQAINVTMFSILAAAMAGSVIWMAAIEFRPVWTIYRSLSLSDQGHVLRLFNSLGMLFLLLSFVAGTIGMRRSRASPSSKSPA